MSTYLQISTPPKKVLNFASHCAGNSHRLQVSLRSWRDFARECFCCGSEAENTSGEAVRGLEKSRVEFHSQLRRSRIPSRASPGREYGGSTARPLNESRQLRRLTTSERKPQEKNGRANSPGGELLGVSRHQDFTRPFFPRGLLTVALDGQSERETTRNL